VPHRLDPLGARLEPHGCFDPRDPHTRVLQAMQATNRESGACVHDTLLEEFTAIAVYLLGMSLYG